MIDDTLLRGGAMATAAFVALVLLASQTARSIRYPVCALAICSIDYLLASAPFEASLPWAIRAPSILGAILLPVAFCWLVTVFFLDSREHRVPWLWLSVASVPLAFLGLWRAEFGMLRGILLLGLDGGLLYVAATTARHDLVENRRQVRPVFLGLMALLGVVISFVELAGLDDPLPAFVYPLQSGAFLALSIAFGLWLLTQNIDAFPPEGTPPPKNKSDDRDPQLLEALQRAMDQGIWRQEGLSIRDLSDILGAPEHRVRAAINRNLGYRNFPAYINSHRIAAAKQALAAPENARRTVLEIAYDSGFASLGPFNKAFRAETGQNPTQFRRDTQVNASHLT